MTERKAGRVQSVDRAARALKHVAGCGSRGARLVDVSTALGISRSSAHALLRTLEDHGLVAETDGPRFVLGTTMITLGDIAAAQRPLAEAGRPVLAALSQSTGLTTRLAVADNGFPVFVARVDGPGSVRFQTPLGGRETPHSSAAGKVILADIDEDQIRSMFAGQTLQRRTDRTIVDLDQLVKEIDGVRHTGYAVDDEEDAEGIFCIAAGVRDSTGRVVGAISVSGIASDRRARPIEQLGALVQQAAGELSSRIGF
ncbi:IclR family transcriptional regulator [Aeromicrobium sp. YIM 150415]|uniref:IclR family transcriptional regulator n=1 Tax=Aeromicrobium sp. YIM 150415 TaxID=2803912 RepID=UPI0019625649|nr:IclR family transcriptional regulator [Aeromicrobium sp. YIM 150415]MBM9463617.1 IclR family transcriptional regulator [Aeromicrobium sp. YIM 150415]